MSQITICDVCKKPLVEGEDVVLLPRVGDYHQACYLASKDDSSARCSADSAEEKMPVTRPVAFRVPRVVNDRLSKTEFRLFDDEDEARRAACDIGADYDGLFLVADRRAAFFAQPHPSTAPQAMTRSEFVRIGITQFKEHELREIVATFCKLPGIAPQCQAEIAK